MNSLSTMHSAMLERSATFYQEQLKRSPRAIAYLKGRGVTGEVAARYRLGYAPAKAQGLREVFPNYGVGALVDCGLVATADSGRRYDRFRDRIMFPIREHTGRLVGFGGRVIDEGAPKYLNSPESPLFNKRDLLYGLDIASASIASSGVACVVEGFLDVVALSQFGFNNAVATLGTATTCAHVARLLSIAPRVVFCFDGDNSGRLAALRVLESCFDLVGDLEQVSFIFLPSDCDPDTYIRTSGPAAFQALVDNAFPLVPVLLAELEAGRDLNYAEGRAGLVYDATPWLQRAPNPRLRSSLLEGVALASDCTVQELEIIYDLAPLK